ncbi:hypothetical protein [Nocardia sp. NPDC003979]
MRTTETPTALRRSAERSAARREASRTAAEEALARSRAERAQLEQGRLFRADLVAEAESLFEDISALHDELREIYRQLGMLRRRFPSLPPAPRLAGYPPVVVPPAPAATRPAPTSATA